MADVAATRSAANQEKPEHVAAERVDEGRWEGEGGGTLPKHVPGLPNSPSPNPDSDQLKAGGDGKATETAPKKDGAGGHLADAALGSGSTTASTTHETEQKQDTLPASSSSSSLPQGQRKKSISEKLEEAWHDVKAKAAGLFERKDKKESKEDTKSTESHSTTAGTAATAATTSTTSSDTAASTSTSTAPSTSSTGTTTTTTESSTSATPSQ